MITLMWVAVPVTAALAALSVWLSATGYGSHDFDPFTGVLLRGWCPVMASLGLLIAVRRPANRIGALLVALALAGSVASAAGDSSHALSGSTWSSVLGVIEDLAWVALVTSIGLLLIFFPDGRLPSPRWRPLAWALIVYPPVTTVLDLLAPTTMHEGRLAPNPFGGVVGPIGTLAEMLLPILVLPLAALLALASTAAIIGLRRSHGIERQQLKWFAYAALLLGATLILDLWDPRGPWSVLFNIVPLTFPVVITVAILRHRLYDIDVLINRTLVYGATTATLVATYALGVLAVHALLRPFTQGNELAVAASTLAVAALVQPVRRRIQSAVDRRFYRSRYDAARIVDTFALRLRDEVDLDALRVQLIVVARDTMQPAHATVWLRRQ
ncbi:MAG TPA: hypothetical protein VI056_01200 [Candidatus Limnocylindria bacterium]